MNAGRWPAVVGFAAADPKEVKTSASPGRPASSPSRMVLPETAHASKSEILARVAALAPHMKLADVTTILHSLEPMVALRKADGAGRRP